MLTHPPLLIYASDEQTDSIAEGQCDCACSSITPTIAPTLVVLADVHYHINPDLVRIELNDGYAAYLSALSSRLVVLNQTAQDIVTHFAEPKCIADLPSYFIALFGEDYIQDVVTDLVRWGILASCQEQQIVFEKQSDTLNVWLHITDRCNLRCTYCYLPHVQEDMSLEIGRAALDAAFRSATHRRYANVKIKYAGGEPLIRFPLVVALQEYAQAKAKQLGLTIDAVVLSNGTLLTPQIVSTMKALSLRLMVSLDGLGNDHDCQRPFAGGQRSNESVLQGIEIALANDLIPDISITVTGRNAPGIAKVVRWVVARDLPFSLNFYRENNLSMTHPDLQLEETVIIEGMRSAFAIIEESLPRRSVLASLVDRANLNKPHLHTCSVGQDYLVFDYRGRIAKCQMQLNAPITDLHAVDPLALIQSDKSGIQNLAVTEKEGCRSCEWKYWCTGGCSLMTYRATGRYDISSPNCHIYKALYPEAVRLEGLRVLKYNQHKTT